MSEELKVDQENAVRILDYWFTMEFLNQQNLEVLIEKGNKATKYMRELTAERRKKPNKVVENFVRLEDGDNLQTVLAAIPEQLKLFHRSDFTVYIGCMKKETCILEIAKNIQWNGQSPDANNDEIALAALRFSRHGRYLLNSLSISPLAWAMKKLSGGTENASQKLSLDNFYSDTRAIETQIENLFEASGNGAAVSEELDSHQVLDIVSHNLLKSAEDLICKELDIKDKDIKSFLAVYFKLFESQNDDEEDETEIGLHMDFFSKDIAFVADGLRKHRFSKGKEKLLLDYILGLNRDNSAHKKTSNRFDVVKPENEEALYQFMSENLTAAKAPLGKWPSRFMPALMQQIAVNLATDPNRDLPVFSVNGPPGTGKTTLLKEIIVSNIVEKAILLAEYDDPDQAFYDYSFSHGNGPDNSYNQYVKKYHRLKNEKINAYSILVLSSNNKAVENITKELPIEKDLLDAIKPSEAADGPNDDALAELTKLFTVSESKEKLPFIRKIWEENTSEEGEKKNPPKEVVEDQPDIYFSRLATDLLNADNKEEEKQEAFGLISASLGKKSNIYLVETKVIAPLLDIMKRNVDIEQRKQNYLRARERFMTQLALVQNHRIKLDELSVREKEIFEVRRKLEITEQQTEAWQEKKHLQLSEIDDAERKQYEVIRQLYAEKEEHNTINSIRYTCKELETKIKVRHDSITAGKERIKTLQNSVSILETLFKSTHYREVQKSIAQEYDALKQHRQELDKLNKNLDEERGKMTSAQAQIDRIESEISAEIGKLNDFQPKRKAIDDEGKRLETELAVTRKKAEEYKDLFEKTKENYQNQDSYERGFVLDRQFISDVLSTDIDISTKAQLRNPWISEHYNREREKLFLYALQMTKEFILGSKKCRDNFKHLDCLWSGCYNKGEQIKFIDDDLSKCTAAAYETLFLLIPVVSSTFASVQGFFKNVKEEDIVGTLIVDEAGQASPHMAIGALCRSRKAVIVGDPKQVEPVVTDDQDLLKQTYTDDMFKPYKDKTNSVQRFADVINPYGTYLKNAQGVEEWVGCPLLVHRRCISPMYDISNDISYNNIMKQQTAHPDAEKLKTFIAEKSQWINVRGKEEGIKRHFVKEQGEKVVAMLEVAFSKNSTPDVFIISPFKTVVSGIKEHIKSYVGDCKRNGVNSSLKEHEKTLFDWMDKNIGTVHNFQGKEAAEVIFLLGCDTSDDAAPAIKWVNNNIVNVAATRAKFRFYVVGDIEAWKQSKCVKRAKKILDSYDSGSLGWVPQNYNPDGGYTLVITEKPSVAEAYAKALCVWNEPSNDFYEGNGYLISWCLGHLVELVTPEQYDPKYKKWNINDLPIIPDVWKYQIMDSKNPNEKQRIMQRFDALKTLMNRDDVTTILCATDAGREGELIFRLVYQQAECKKPFKRIWLSSMEPASIRKAFENPHPASDFDSLYESARCRQLADWLVGMNATRLFTELNKKDNGKALSVGRVVSPTMAMIVDREKEIDTFAPETHYTVNLNVGGTTFISRRFETEEEAIQVKQKCKRSTSPGS